MEELKENMEHIKEQYQYKMDSTDELIIDKPSKPLTKKNKSKDIEVDDIKVDDIKVDDIKADIKNQKIEKKIMKEEIKSNKDIYESYIKELKYFSLTINNDIIYDSSIDKTGIYPLVFDNDYFILYGKKYSYNGLKIQKINKK